MSLHPTRRCVERYLQDPSCPDPYSPIPDIDDENRGCLALDPESNDITYNEYLLSPEWREYRQAVIDRQGGRCAMCPGKAQHVHHRTYANIGWEDDDDCVAVCRRCHEKHHGKKGRRRR